MYADDLMRRVSGRGRVPGQHSGRREFPDHPLVKQALRDCLDEAMDFDGLSAVSAASSRRPSVVARDTPEPSVFSHES